MRKPKDDPAADEEKTTPLPGADSGEPSAETLRLPGGSAPAGGRPGGTLFSGGQVVAGRYRIARFLAQGGMGEVYEAQDEELGGPVALKTIRAEIASHSRAIDRFKREIQLSRKVTHPNVCRIFDISHHRDEAGRDVAFLTMELLRGETLSQRLARRGKLDPAEALPIVRQAAAALAAAHEQGIVHRDFKSGNIMLVESPEPSGGSSGRVRAVVTDFGLSQAAAGGADLSTSLTGTGEFVGTPAYMAPEQVEGGEITGAADLYALGVVMFEMVTGSRPFTGDSPLSTVVKRLKEPPPSPRLFAPDLDPRWEAAILRCLERKPEDRFASPLDLVRALEGEAVPAGPAAARRRQQRVRRRWTAAGIGAALLLSAAVIFLARSRRPGPAPIDTAGSRGRRSIAVLGFKNLAGRADALWLSPALSEMLRTELAAGERLRVVSGENVARMKMDLSLPDADSLARDTLGRIRGLLGTDLVLLGSYLDLGKDSGGQIRLDLRLQDAASGETLASVAETGTEEKLFELVSRTGADLRAKLGVGQLAAGEAVTAQASLPSTPDAARLYAEGLARLHRFDALAARDFLEKAAAADPSFPHAHAALAEAWSALGYDARARDEARRALELSESLPREERLSIEGRYRESTREWEKAVEIYRTLWGFFPDNLEYGLRLAAAQSSAGKGAEAYLTVAAMRRLPEPASRDPRIDLAEATAAQGLGDYKRELAATSEAARKASAAGARLLLARARLLQGWALKSLGDPRQGLAAMEEARDIYAAAGDRGGVGNAVNNIAIIHYYQGQLAEAKKVYEQALAIRREVGDEHGVAGTLHNIANILLYQGDLDGARKMFEESIATFRRIGDRSTLAVALHSLSTVQLVQGDLEGTRKLNEEALGIARETGNKSFEAYCLDGIASALLEEGDLAGSRRRFEEALAIRKNAGEKGTIAEDRFALARVAYEEGNLDQAESESREVAAQMRPLSQWDTEMGALIVLGRCLLDQNKLPEARRALHDMGADLPRIENRAYRLDEATLAARIEAAAGDPRPALRRLDGVLADARRAGLVHEQFEARLAHGEIELRRGDAAAGRRELESLHREALARGFGLMVRKVNRALE